MDDGAESPLPILEIPLHHKSITSAGVQDEVGDERLLILPELRLDVLAQGIDKAVGVEHGCPYQMCLALIPQFVVSQMSHRSQCDAAWGVT
jgi:hypothetical protein